MKLLNTLNGSIILEVSEKLKKQLLGKFKLETQDSEEQIVKYINDFERFKQSLPTDKRDITRYDYKTIKSLIDSKEINKNRKSEINSAITNFIKKDKGTPAAELKSAIKKFFEIQSEIKKSPKDINKYSYLTLINFLQKNFEDLLTQKLIRKFKTENQMLTNEQMLFYINNFIQNFDNLPSETPSVDSMNFSQFEHLIDEFVAKQGVEKKSQDDLKNIDIVYDADDLLIFSPKTKDQCIRLGYGRSWCTSRLGGSNLYYNYRLRNSRTLYYVLDKSKNYEDRFFATVVLVDPRGGTSFADKTNSGKFSGHENLDWDEISSYIPKLANLKDLFVSRPLSEDEIQMRDKYQNIEYDSRYGRRLPNNQTPVEYFDSPKEIELWMEINSPQLADEDYASLPPDLKKKYIALGFDLTAKQIGNSEATVLNYYANKKIEKIKQTTLNNLSDSDIALLNSPIFKKIKEELKERFAVSLTAEGKGETLKIDNLKSGNVGKFISLYGLEEVLESMGDDLKDIIISVGDSGNFLEIPKSISKFKNLRQINLQNNALDKFPMAICDVKSLQFLGLSNNPQLTSLPECLGNLPDLEVINFKDSGITEIPNSIKEKFYMVGPQMYQIEDAF